MSLDRRNDLIEIQLSGILFIFSIFLSRTVFSLWTGNDTTCDVMVRSEEIPRVARYLKQKDLEYQVIIDDLQKEIDGENHVLTEQQMLELEGRKGSTNFFKQHRIIPIRLFHASLNNSPSVYLFVAT